MNNSDNLIYPLYNAIKFKIGYYINKLSNRIRCEHLEYHDVYCNISGLYMFSKCNNCGKKRYI